MINAIFLKKNNSIVGVIEGEESCIKFLECKSYKLFIKDIASYEKAIESSRIKRKELFKKPNGTVHLYYTAIVFDEVLLSEGEINKQLVLSKNPNAKEVNVWRICDY